MLLFQHFASCEEKLYTLWYLNAAVVGLLRVIIITGKLCIAALFRSDG